MNDRGWVAVIFGRRHDAVFSVAGVKGGDADHQGRGSVSTTGVSDRKGLRHRSGSSGGDHPRATGTRRVRPRAAITAQSKPKRLVTSTADLRKHRPVAGGLVKGS
jgi:hypothetical protein